MLVESRERGVFTPALTNNRWGREKERWSPTRRKPVIKGGKKLNFGAADHYDRNRRRDRRGNGGKPSEQGVLLDLSDQAVVIGAMRILVEEMVKLGRHREGERAKPQQKHQTGGGKPAAPARLLRCAPELQSLLTMYQIRSNASTDIPGGGAKAI
jgi:hypothetical protein